MSLDRSISPAPWWALRSVPSMLGSVSRSGTRAAFAQQEADDLEAIAAALRDYLATSGPAMAEGDLRVLSLASLRAANGLGAGAARRYGMQDVAPLGQSYVVRVRRGPEGVWAVAYAAGTPDAGLLRRAGISATGATHLAFKREVAGALAQRSLVSGVVPPGATAVDGITFRFTQPLGPLLSTAPADPLALVMVGFDRLSLGGVGGRDPRPDSTPRDLGACNVVPSLNGATRTCPAGHREVARWPHCGRYNKKFPHYDGYASSAGPITMGVRKNPIRGQMVASCTFDPGLPGYGEPFCTGGGRMGLHREDFDVVVNLGSAEFVTNGCHATYYGWTRHGYSGCQRYGLELQYGFGVRGVGSPGQMCRTESDDNVHGGEDLLCCQG